MSFIDKLKNVFFEEIEEEKDEDSVKLAKKIEIPKRKVTVEPKADGNDNVNSSKVSSFDEKNSDIVSFDIEENTSVKNKVPMMFEEEDFFGSEPKELKETREERLGKKELYSEKKELYPNKKEVSYAESVTKSTTYSSSAYSSNYYSKTSNEKDTKVFKPSPIISPIYGILDKNYKKEEVVTRKEARVVSSYTKTDLDSVRNKAFGNETVNEEKVSNEVSSKPTREEKKFYDVNNTKPSVDKITIADADEYYNELGLAYNVDYDDTSRDIQNSNSKMSTRAKRYQENDHSNDNDNLFDLIDSMYNKED